ncbi:pyridoxal phosphate-dependent aminotransferase [Taibaiella soli]|uniref:Aminotransferase n=1 Tax=Taibaiella soli TaxID=1649169 RepID=A0A2W2AUS9_9BACT|nr:pyridoxal phosphate-dependent aminotransferase [Taibaiella soli]PZF71438.1 aspartate aminotransferase [Taibaiella soli]
MQLADRLKRFSEPQTIRMAKLSRELKAQGLDIIDLSLGEPDFRTPEHICNAATEAMNAGYTKYPPVAGIPELRAAICTKLQRDNGLQYAPEEVMVSTGAKQSLANAILCTINPGDEVIIPTPFWVTYGALVQLAEGTNVFVDCTIDTDFKITPAQLEAAITEKTRMFIFSSPCNPTGTVYSKEDLAALVAVFERYPNILVISDEIYEYINFRGGHESIAQFPSMRNRTVVVNGFSKGFAMTGWRLGYMAGPKEIVQACEKFQGQFTSGANSISQRAGVVALTGDMAPTKLMTEAFLQRRDFIIPALANIPGVKINNPEGAFYAFPDISSFFGKSFGETTINNDEEMAMYLLHEGHVTTVMGSAFGANRCLRLSFATSMGNLENAVKRIAEALGKLK